MDSFLCKVTNFFGEKVERMVRKMPLRWKKRPALEKMASLILRYARQSNKKNFYFLGFMSNLHYLCIKIDYSSFPSKEQDEVKVH